MKRMLFAGALALAVSALAGCAGLTDLTGATVSATTAYNLANAANAAESAADVYIKLPYCSTTVVKTCQTVAGHNGVKQAVLAMRPLRNGLITALQSANGGPIAIASYNNLETTLTALTGALSQYQQ